MEDVPHSDTGKRKRSPEDSLVKVSIPSPFQYASTIPPNGLDSQSTIEHPLPKRPRLPEKPPVAHSDLTSALVDLPSSILQTIFFCLDPLSLARLQCVNRRFQDLLDPKRSRPSEQAYSYNYKGQTFQTSLVSTCSPDNIWKISRRRHVPNMPKPMDGLSERDFFALAFGLACQHCGKHPVNSQRQRDPWKAAPGEFTVCTLWSFRVRSCVQCLAPRLRKV